MAGTLHVRGRPRGAQGSHRYNSVVRTAARATTPPQEVRFCRSADGVRIAYAVHGSGPPLVISTCWLSHLQFDWESPVWRHFLADLGEFATVIRFDERGYGLSDWDVTDFSLDMRIARPRGGRRRRRATTGSRCLAMAQGGPVAIAYAARHPERVTRLLFYNSYADAARDQTPEESEVEDTFDQMIKVGWARPDSTFRRVFTSMLIPAATEEQKGWLDELQRVAASADHAPTPPGTSAATTMRRAACRSSTCRPWSCTRRGEQINGFDEGRLLAAAIRGARLVPLDSENHIILEDETAWPVFVREVEEFLAPGPRAPRRPARDARSLPAAAARARGAHPGRPGLRQRRHRRGPAPQRPHGRAPPPERLRQARRAGEVRAARGRRPPAHHAPEPPDQRLRAYRRARPATGPEVTRHAPMPAAFPSSYVVEGDTRTRTNR